MIWLAGDRGMLGSCLCSLLGETERSFVSSDRDVDISDPSQIRAFTEGRPISTIFNCAAFTDVRACETRYELAYRINAEGPKQLAQWAAENDAHLFHISTDYVFDGNAHGPYDEAVPPHPINAYGRTKLAGERFMQASACRWTIVRTSWLYGKNGKNFVYTVLSRLGQQGRMCVVNDQCGSPTYAADLAQALLDLQDAPCGLYHFANAGAATWFDFAREILRLAGKHAVLSNARDSGAGREGALRIDPTSSDAFNDPVKRPPFSALSTDKVSKALAGAPRPWREALEAFMLEIKDSGFPLEGSG